MIFATGQMARIECVAMPPSEPRALTRGVNARAIPPIEKIYFRTFFTHP